MPPPDAWVAPAARVLTVLHRPAPDVAGLPESIDGDPVKGRAACGLLMLESELWVPVERRPADRVCRVCEAEGRAEDVQEAML